MLAAIHKVTPVLSSTILSHHRHHRQVPTCLAADETLNIQNLYVLSPA